MKVNVDNEFRESANYWLKGAAVFSQTPDERIFRLLEKQVYHFGFILDRGDLAFDYELAEGEIVRSAETLKMLFDDLGREPPIGGAIAEHYEVVFSTERPRFIVRLAGPSSLAVIATQLMGLLRIKRVAKCEHCGSLMFVVRDSKKFCSDSCRFDGWHGGLTEKQQAKLRLAKSVLYHQKKED